MEDWKMYNFQNGCDICILQMDINKQTKEKNLSLCFLLQKFSFISKKQTVQESTFNV